MTEQSHKREMTDALLGDFERLRARRQRLLQQTSRPARPERVVSTPSPRIVEGVSTLPEPRPADERRRSWLRLVFGRGD